MIASARGRVRGFTLIELAVVVAIVGLLLGGLLIPLATQVEITRARTAEKNVSDIRDALYGFAVANGRLPCPDTDSPSDGRENYSSGACASAEGEPPWADLGTERLDPWGRAFVYRVDPSFADDPSPDIASFKLDSNAGLNVYSTAPATCPSTSDLVAAYVPAVVLSLGSNGGDTASFSTDEQENNNSDDCFVEKDYQSSFDDIVSWISPYVLKALMVRAERLP